LAESVLVRRSLLKELYEHFAKIEEILATLEELINRKGLQRIKKNLEEYNRKDYVTAKNSESIKEALMKNSVVSSVQ